MIVSNNDSEILRKEMENSNECNTSSKVMYKPFYLLMFLTILLSVSFVMRDNWFAKNVDYSKLIGDILFLVSSVVFSIVLFVLGVKNKNSRFIKAAKWFLISGMVLIIAIILIGMDNHHMLSHYYSDVKICDWSCLQCSSSDAKFLMYIINIVINIISLFAVYNEIVGSIDMISEINHNIDIKSKWEKIWEIVITITCSLIVSKVFTLIFPTIFNVVYICLTLSFIGVGLYKMKITYDSIKIIKNNL